MAKRKPSKKNASFGQRLISGLSELKTSLEQNEKLEDRYTVRDIHLNLEPNAYSAQAVQELRHQIHASQAVFAQLIGVSVFTIRSWEQDKREIPKMARVLMDEIKANPKRWAKKLEKAAIQERHGSSAA